MIHFLPVINFLLSVHFEPVGHEQSFLLLGLALTGDAGQEDQNDAAHNLQTLFPVG